MRSSARFGDAPAHAVLRRGAVVGGRWIVERLIGSGGMALVYVARHTRIGARAAIKVLHPRLSGTAAVRDRFVVEARNAARVNHPNVVRVYDAGTLDDGLPYLIMEYVDGESLRDLALREAPLPWPRARRICLQLCEALDAVHGAGLVHCDVKPSNCICVRGADGADVVKLLDFGIAVDVRGDDEPPISDGDVILGTPDYISPEQAQVGRIDHRSDLYSLGVLMYLLLTGELPFVARRAEQQLTHHVYAQPRDPILLRPQLDPRVSALLLRALRKTPARRFASARELAAAVRALDERRWTIPRARAVASAMALGLAIGGGIFGAATADGAPSDPPEVEPVGGVECDGPPWPPDETAAPTAADAGRDDTTSGGEDDSAHRCGDVRSQGLG